ncbi:MAG: hypothetical protein IJL98_10190 [Lachnospiraceae bacterium]|nr:hypothetical protein [Lachnospiraceae bacterium]
MKKIILLSILLIVLIAGGIFTAKSFGSDEIEKAFGKYAKENGIQLLSTDHKNEKLEVVFRSSGRGRCTSEDLQAVATVYELVQYKDILSGVSDVGITIKDCLDQRIYNLTLNKITSSDTAEKKHNTVPVSEKEADISALFSGYSMTVDEISYKALSSDSDKAVIKVSGSADAVRSLLSDIHGFRNSLRLIFQKSEKITCSEIELKADEKTLVYIHDDYRYTLVNIWMDETVEEAFAEENGPMK